MDLVTAVVEKGLEIKGFVDAYRAAPKVITIFNKRVIAINSTVDKLKSLPQKIADPSVKQGLELLVEALEEAFQYMQQVKDQNSWKHGVSIFFGGGVECVWCNLRCLQLGKARRLLRSQEDSRKFVELTQQLDIAMGPLQLALQVCACVKLGCAFFDRIWHRWSTQ